MAAVERRFPEWLRHTNAPGARTFAVLGGIEACARAIVSSVLPLTAYRIMGDAAGMSRIYLLVGLVSLAIALLLPGFSRVCRRRFLFTAGALCLAIAAIFGGLFDGRFVLVALFVQAIGTVTITICFNAYLMDYIERTELGGSESLRLFYSAAAWTVGPFLGVWLMDEIHIVVPFALSLVASLVLIATFWWFRLGDGKAIARAAGPPPNPMAYLGRFFRRKRLVAGWLFASIRSCGWVAFYLYVPIFAVESGLGEKAGGFMVSLGAVYLFVTPLMLRWARRRSVRSAVMTGFACGAASWAAAAALLSLGTLPSTSTLSSTGMVLPMGAVLTALVLETAALFMVLLDMVGGLPFLMAVKPSERTEMSAVYSTFRDVSNVVTPAIGSLILLYLPLGGVFVALGAMFAATSALAGALPAQLGVKRIRQTTTRGDEPEPQLPAANVPLPAGRPRSAMLEPVQD